MVDAIFLLVGALAVRVYGSALRTSWPGATGTVLGSMIGAIAAWLAACAAGAWSPVWIAVIGGALGGHAIMGLPRIWRLQLSAILDGLIFTIAAQLSIPPLDVGVTAIGAVLVAGIALLLDISMAHVPALIRASGAVIASVAGAAGLMVLFASPHASWLVQAGAPSSRLERLMSFANLGIVSARDQDIERRELPTGAVAWLQRPAGSGPFPAAIFFHGAHPAGSFQPAAVAARRALRDAGFVVLAVDHPGFGESPSPDPGARLAEWDPLPTAAAALDLLREDESVGIVIAAGHSMGTADVFRLLASPYALDGAIVFSTTGLYEPERMGYWYQRFHAVRRLPPNSLSFDQVMAIIDLYYQPRRMVPKLASTHPLIIFGRFDRDGPHMAGFADQLYSEIQGAKRVWYLPGSHHFNARGHGGLVAADMRPVHDLASHLRQFAEEMKHVEPVSGLHARSPADTGSAH